MQNVRNKRLETNKRRDREACYNHHQAPKKHFAYCFVEREKMNDIFTELDLEMQAAVFQQEIIVPSIVQSMSNEKIE